MWRRLLGRAKNDDTGDQPLAIPVDPSPTVGFGVYFTKAETDDAAGLDFNAIAKSWLDSHTDGHARQAIRMFIEHGALEFVVAARAQVPEPPVGLLFHTSRGELEERRFVSATHVLVVRTRDSVRHKHLGIWSALAAARAAALELNGIVLDPVIPRILSIESNSRAIPPNLEVHMTEHIIVPMSVGDSGLAWMTTSGLAKFGLPDFELWDLPPNFDQMTTVVNGIAQHVLQTFAALATDLEGNQLRLEPEIQIGQRDLAEASGRQSVGAQNGPTVMIRLEFGPSERAQGGPPMIQVLPPRSFRGEKTVWYASLLDQLLGSEEHIRGVATGNQEMESAHKKAIAELPEVKRRLAVGLRPGQTLFIKKGFPTDSGLNEFMWIVITKWTGSDLTGQLANTSHYRKDLAMGQTVMLKESEVFDWMLLHPDGRREGGYTSAAAISKGEDLPTRD